MHRTIFFLRGDPSPDMALGFVDIEHLPHLLIELRIHPAQALGHVHMYGGFTDSELLRRRPNRRLMRNDIFAELYGSFLHDTFQDEPLRFPLK